MPYNGEDVLEERAGQAIATGLQAKARLTEATGRARRESAACGPDGNRRAVDFSHRTRVLWPAEAAATEISRSLQMFHGPCVPSEHPSWRRTKPQSEAMRSSTPLSSEPHPALVSRIRPSERQIVQPGARLGSPFAVQTSISISARRWWMRISRTIGHQS